MGLHGLDAKVSQMAAQLKFREREVINAGVPSNCGGVIASGFKRGCRNKGSAGNRPVEMTRGTLPNDIYIQVEMYRSITNLITCLRTYGANTARCF